MKRLCFAVLVVVLLAFPSDARADVAPPIYPPGSNPQPGAELTQVRMAAETVVIEVLKDTAPQSLGRARVTADFTMHNLGTAEESMAVRFPISSNDGRGGYPEISNLQITVDGRRVQYRRANYPDVGWSDEEVPWAEFDVTFPVGQEVSITVTYDLKGSGYYPYTAFYYILETGAGWKDTIGSADLILRLPYEASPQNVILDTQIGWAETTPGGVFQGNEVRWHFDEFEPGQNQPVKNMEFALVAPPAWETVLTARANVEKYPNDGEVWGMLGKAYKEVFLTGKSPREDAGGQELYRLSVEAYEKCLSLEPNDAQWHAGFADLLAERATWEVWASGITPEAMRALQEIRTALELAPNDPVVQEIAHSMVYLLYGGISENGERFDFPWLTATPTSPPPTPTLAPSEEPTATPPTPPAATDTPPAEPTQVSPTQTTPTQVPERSSPICGSAAFLPLLAMLWIIRKRK
jgi:tetratricopeptide (TPR) repeat protein